MNIIHTVAALRHRLALAKENQAAKTIGFVPTMGALHQGHFALVKQSLADNDLTVVSIFVNPTQFNNREDLEKYPRDLERDSNYLSQIGVDIVFAPSVEEIYPVPDTRQFDFGQIDKVMEGEHRPGHFNGVAQVVSRLFDIVQPDKAYFGEKDFQQLAIIRAMVCQLHLDVQIIPMAIVRQESGLAMSSRNERLTPHQREVAANIYKVLTEAATQAKLHSVSEIEKQVIDTLNAFPELKVEYFDIVNGNSLRKINAWSDSQYTMACIAVFCGEIRLIDNIRIQ